MLKNPKEIEDELFNLILILIENDPGAYFRVQRVISSAFRSIEWSERILAQAAEGRD